MHEEYKNQERFYELTANHDTTNPLSEEAASNSNIMNCIAKTKPFFFRVLSPKYQFIYY